MVYSQRSEAKRWRAAMEPVMLVTALLTESAHGHPQPLILASQLYSDCLVLLVDGAE